jgi:sulfatase maturation enzyme AslB (radical SAM superfamily)
MNDYSLIDNKIASYAEVVVCLFDHCNLQCAFCPQDHDSQVGTSQQEILSKVPTISHWINKNERSNFFKVHIMGGELFQDYWIEKGYLNIYREFIELIRASTDPKKDICFNFVSNLVFTRSEEVLRFFELPYTMLSISYDPKGRFSEGTKSIFLENVSKFENKIEMVSVVLTEQNIKAIQMGDSVFDQLYKKYIIDFDHLLPSTENAERLLPLESQKQEFLKYLIVQYPNCLNVAPFVEEKPQHKMTCTRGNSLTILKDGTIPEGCSGALFLNDSTTEELSSPEIVSDFVFENECLTCEFYKNCPFPCFVSEQYKSSKKNIKGCLYKDVFKMVRGAKSC